MLEFRRIDRRGAHCRLGDVDLGHCRITPAR
jgi:hypothetical protein